MSDSRNPAPPNDQLVFQNPVKRFDAELPSDRQPPNTQAAQDLGFQIDCGEYTYRGTGRLAGRRALITGGSSGIGAAIAIAFAREGADVAINYLPDDQASALWVQSILENTGCKAVLLPGDLAERRVCEALPGQAAASLGGLDILVNHAGMQVAAEQLEDISDQQFTATYDVNIIALFRVTKAALAYLPAGSAIINTTSRQAYTPVVSAIDYASTKAAINNFTKGLAQQLAPRGIRVNAVAPGPVVTSLQFEGAVPEQNLPAFGSNAPIGRPGQATEVAPCYVFLASAESSLVIGATINVNGGFPTP